MFDDDAIDPPQENDLETVASVEGTDSEGVTVVTPRGYRFQSSETDTLVTSQGLKVSAEQATALVAESKGLVTVTEPIENPED